MDDARRRPVIRSARNARPKASMLRRVMEMPAGMIGFEAIGEVEDDDWEEAVEPVLRLAIAAGEEVRLLHLLGPEAGEVEGDAVSADTGFAPATPACRARRRGQRRGRIRPALRGLSFLFPGRPGASRSASWWPRRTGSRRDSARSGGRRGPGGSSPPLRPRPASGGDRNGHPRLGGLDAGPWRPAAQQAGVALGQRTRGQPVQDDRGRRQARERFVVASTRRRHAPGGNIAFTSGQDPRPGAHRQGGTR